MLSVQRLLVFSSLALSALSSPSPRVARRTTASPCSTPIVESSSSVLVGNNTVLLEVLTCPDAGGIVADGLGFGNAFCGLLPIFCPPKPYKPEPKPKPKPSPQPYPYPTKENTATVTITDTVTDVEPTTIIGTTTVVETATEVITATATVTVVPSPTPSAIDVCGGICNTTCSEVGQLPPTTDDCQVIKDAVAIFQGNACRLFSAIRSAHKSNGDCAAPTFIADPLHTQQLTFGTCRFFFENLGTDSVEYCWNDLANTGSASASQCFPPSMPFSTLAVCEALDNTWEVG
ncbi:hypothetical protein OF83DRAFT_1100406 [Amylostereum chailletii]|nr:hypothetical protein OF83DRAFT_1100406 [Amylostereum chailletii]